MYELLEGQKRASKDVAKLSKVRKDGFIPGIIFGKEIESISIMIGKSLFAKCLSKSVQIIELVVGSDKHLVNIDSIQKDPVSGKILHISFHKLQAGQKTTVSIPVLLVGENEGEGIVGQLMQEVSVIALPQDIPASIEVNIESLEMGSAIFVRDLAVSDKVSFQEADLDKPVANCSAPSKEEPEEAPADEEGAEGAEDAEAKEGDQPAASE